MTVRHTHPWWPRYLAAGLAVAAFTILAAAYVASATDVNVTQSAACVDAGAGRFDVTVTAHNVYDKPLHLVVNNPASPIGPFVINPGQTWSYTFHVIDGPWTVTFTTTDAHLHGDISHTWTLTDVCGVPPTTTTSPSPTTCDQANPPRADCGTTTTSPSTVPTVQTAPPESICAGQPQPSTGPGTVVCESPAPTPPTSGPSESSPPPPAQGGGAAPHVSTTVALSLPVTGMAAYDVLWIGGSVFFLGVVCIAISRKQARRHELDEWGMK